MLSMLIINYSRDTNKSRTPESESQQILVYRKVEYIRASKIFGFFNQTWRRVDWLWTKTTLIRNEGKSMVGKAVRYEPRTNC